MQVITPKQRMRRWDELNAPDIDRLMKKAAKQGKGGTAQYILYGKYGITGDFDTSITGNEWGEERYQDENH